MAHCRSKFNALAALKKSLIRARPPANCGGWGTTQKEQITGHGFRATARTLIRELFGADREVNERHLAYGSDEELVALMTAPLS